jgi:serine phosphatase RsbU (regulator of sigma subunit)
MAETDNYRVLTLGPKIRVIIGIVVGCIVLLSGVKGTVVSVGLVAVVLMVIANGIVLLSRSKATMEEEISREIYRTQAFWLAAFDMLIITYVVYITGSMRTIWVSLYVLVSVGITIMLGRSTGMKVAIFGSICYIVVNLLQVTRIIPIGVTLAPALDASFYTNPYIILAGSFIVVMSIIGGVFYSGKLMQTVLKNEKHLKKVNAELTETKKRIEQELHDARSIQMELFPKSMKVSDDIEVAGRCMISDEVGGDYYDFMKVDSCLWICLGDVVGSGGSAAILMSMVKTYCNHNIGKVKSVSEMVTLLNSQIMDRSDKKMVRFFAACIDLEKHVLKYANAGYSFPYIFRPSESVPRYIEIESFPLGIKKDITFKEKEMQLLPGDLMVFYSDGIIEARNEGKEMYGYSRFEKAVKAHADGSAGGIVDSILNETRSFQGSMPLGDDLVVLAIKIAKS